MYAIRQGLSVKMAGSNCTIETRAISRLFNCRPLNGEEYRALCAKFCRVVHPIARGSVESERYDGRGRMHVGFAQPDQ